MYIDIRYLPAVCMRSLAIRCLQGVNLLLLIKSFVKKYEIVLATRDSKTTV